MFSLLSATALVIFGIDCWWTYHGPQPATEIFHGVFYSCESLPETPESGGLLHLIKADLNTPGVELYLPQKDIDAVALGWEYRLRYVSSVVRDEHLAAAVNGTLFNSDSTLIRLSGDSARSIETVVANHEVNHVDINSYLMWWDDDLIAHLQANKPPSAIALNRAKWAIAGQSPVLVDGTFREDVGQAADKRTMIAADPQARIVWIACFDKSSYRFAAQTLQQKGAKIGILVDGGTSIAMAIGKDAAGVRSGTVVGNWRPVATQFGIKATPLK